MLYIRDINENYSPTSAQDFSPPLVIHSSPLMNQYTTASTISRITTIILVILAWIAFACWIFYYTILMAGGITLIYVIKGFERGICNGRTQVLDDLEHEETGMRCWRRKAWAWWDKVTTLFVEIAS